MSINPPAGPVPSQAGPPHPATGPGPARAHVRRLRQDGGTYRGIAAAPGLGPPTVSDLDPRPPPRPRAARPPPGANPPPRPGPPPAPPPPPPPPWEEPPMTSDHRVTPGLIHDIVDVLERHGYCRSDDLHADRAIGLIGDLACIY